MEASTFFGLLSVLQIIGIILMWLWNIRLKNFIGHEKRAFLKAETELCQAREEWERTFDTVPDLITILDFKFNVLKINHAVANTLRVSKIPENGLKCYRLFHDMASPPSFCPLSKLIKDGRSHCTDVYIKRLDASFFVSVSPLTDSAGQLIGAVHVARDISDFRLREKQSAHLSSMREKLLRRGTLDEKMKYITDCMTSLFDKPMFRVWRVKEQETDNPPLDQGPPTRTQVVIEDLPFMLIADTCSSFGMEMNGNWPALEASCLDQLMTSDAPWKIFDIGKWEGIPDNFQFAGYRIISSTGIPIGAFLLFFDDTIQIQKNDLLNSVVAATTNVLRSEISANSLRRSEKRYRKLFESLIDVYFRTDASGILKMLSPSVEQVMGYSPEELLNTHARQYWVYPEQRDQLVREIQEKDAVRGKEILLRKKGGCAFWASVNAKQLKDDQGNYMGLEVMFRDVTKKKQAEELMRTQRDLSIALASICDFGEASKICLDTALKLEEVDGGAIYLTDSNSGCLDLIVHRNLSTDFVSAVSHLEEDSLQAKLVYKGVPVFQPYAKMANSFSYSCDAGCEIVHSAGIRAFAMIPMSDDGKIFGCLVVSSTTTDKFSSFSRYCLETVAGQMAAALSRIKMDHYLRSSRHNLKTLFESIDDFLFILDHSGRIIKTNSAVGKRLGYASDELIGMDVIQVYLQNGQIGSHEGVRQIPPPPTTYHSNSIMRPDGHLIPRDGQAIPVETKINPGIWDGKPALFAISRDITLRLKAEEAKRISEERLMAAIDAIDEGFIIFDKDDRVVMYNSKLLDIYNISSDLIKPEVKFEDIIRKAAYRGQYLDAEGKVENWVAERMVLHRCCGENFEQRIHGGRWIRIAERKMEDGSTVGFRVDVTDIKRSEDLLRNALMEKEILLKEIHHRVKNNLAVISSMLNLQIKNNNNPVVEESLKESRSRVRSMALIHETLHQANDLSSVRLKDYIRKLIHDLLSVYENFSDQFSIEYDIEDVYLDINQAVYCGIIINELVTNSLKYAFADNEKGIIRISAKTQQNHEIELNVEDNGVGLPPGFKWEKARTLGMRLISLMVEQLHGSMKSSHRGGLKTVIRWKSSLHKD